MRLIAASKLAACIVGTIGLIWGVTALAQTKPAGGENTVTIKEVSKTQVTFDGHVSKFEYADAARVTFANGHGTVEARAKAIDGFLYFAFEIPDLSPHQGDDIVIMLETANARGDAPEKTATRAYVRRKSENSRAHVGDGKKWADTYADWEYRSTAYATGWEVEARIPLKSLNIDAGKSATLGLAFRIWANEPQKNWNWPAGSDEKKPSGWGTLEVQFP